MRRYFDHHSLLREVVSHRLTALSGPRALLLMAAHPVAFAGFFAHTGALDDPYARLRRTATVMDSVAFAGPRALALLRSVRDPDRERALKEGGAPLAKVAGRALRSLRRR